MARFRLQELGYRIRKARLRRRLTQAQLATAAGLSRTTLNQLENGLFPDIGVKKVQTILETLGLNLEVRPALRPSRPDYIRMACTSASVSFREKLSEGELVRALLSGKAPAGRRPHLRALLEEAPVPVLKGLAEEVGKWTGPGRVAANLLQIAEVLGAAGRTRSWLKTV